MPCKEVWPTAVQVFKIVIQCGINIRSRLRPFGTVHFFKTHFRKLFAVKVSDASMSAAGILDGDIAILKKISGNQVHNGDIVLAEIDGKPELRTYHELDSGHFTLTAPGSGPAIQRTRDEAPIQGILVGLQRGL